MYLNSYILELLVRRGDDDFLLRYVLRTLDALTVCRELNSHGKLSSDPNCCLNRSHSKNILQALIRSILFFLDIIESLDWSVACVASVTHHSPPPPPSFLFLLSFQFSRRTRAEPLATQASGLLILSSNYEKNLNYRGPAEGWHRS